MAKKSFIALLLVSLIIFYPKAIGQEYEQEFYYEYDVPFVPTRNEVVEQMLDIANVNKEDILYDLGCGAGRIVITAAKKFGTHGVGIDIDPVRISESKENAIKECVTDNVQFIEQDLFEADISEATVVTLYLLQSVNLKLRPKLFRELKPGTRIVSHDFDMGEWKYDKTSEAINDYHDHTVYFWILPANVSGNWEWTMSASTDKISYTLHLDQKFQEVNGELTTGKSNITLENIKINGDRLQFTIEGTIKGQKVTQMYDGIVNGNLIEGKAVSNTKSTINTINWKAERDPTTIIPWDDKVSESD